MTAAVLAACLLLAASAEIRQTTPQRLEATTEVRWCATGASAELVVVTGYRVDGRPAGDEQARTVYRIQRSQPTLDGDGVGF
jgi:hypothetical protein